MANTVSLTVEEVRRLWEWTIKNKLQSGHIVEIEVSSGSGIGPTIHAKVWTETKEGIMLDLTDIDKW